MSVVFDRRTGRMLDSAARKTQEAVAALEVGGHRRGETPSDQAPRIPCIGIDSGAIPGTKPGSSAVEIDRCARDLQVAGKELIRRKLAAARGRS